MMTSGGGAYNPFEPLKQSIQDAAAMQATAAQGAAEDLNQAYTKSAAGFEDSMKQLTTMMNQVSNKNISTLKQYSNQGLAYLDPYRQAGTQSLAALQSLLGVPVTAGGNMTPEQMQAALPGTNQYNLYKVDPNEVINGPEAQAKLAMGTDAIERTLAASGQAKSGRALEQLFKYGHQLASTEIGAAQDRADRQISQIQNTLLGITGIGQQAATTQAGLTQNLGTNIAQQNTMAGQSAAQFGILGASNTQNQSNLSAEALANGRLAAGNALANAISQRGQLGFQEWQAGFGEGHKGPKGIGGLLGSIAGPLALMGAEMGGLGGLGLLLGGAAANVGSQNFA
jgi:hypothetical protein